MITVKDILQAVESFAPAFMKENWDNVSAETPHRRLRRFW